ncbi:MAG: cytochrome-c peroxidase [Planctomycetia bacterium]|nr:cytochrome-c peroxidase [Planctomycetia bacterium]
MRLRPLMGSSPPNGAVPPFGLPPFSYPPDNLPTPEKIQLGRQLFFEKRLSRDRSLACTSCHDPAHAFSIDKQFSLGVNGKPGRRHPPTLINVAYNTFQFWDGRIGQLGRGDSLEQQALEPIRDPLEMDLDPAEAAERLRDDPEYRESFRRVFGSAPSPDLIAKAIAAFERTLLFGDAPFDRYQVGDQSALSDSAKRGHTLFFWKATCSACHSGPNFTDNTFHPSVASAMSDQGDVGRSAVTADRADSGHFKTPTLRDVGRHAPFMHDGSFVTLEDVVARYNRGGFDTHYWPPNERPKIENLMANDEEEANHFRANAAPRLRAGFPLHLTEDEQHDLVTFLREGLNSSTRPDITAPQ